MPSMDNIPTDTTQSSYKAPAVHRAFKLLRILTDSDRPLRLSEISERLGCSKSTTHGLVHALVREKALRKLDNGSGYFIGSTLADLVFTDWNYFRINQAARPIIKALRDASQETVFLGAELGKRVLIMLASESGEAIKISARPGTTIPLFAGAVGKVFMACRDEDKVRQLLEGQDLPQYTKNSITNIQTYMTEIATVRQQGYAIDDEEYIKGVRALAVALQNKRGPSMAVWVVGMASSMTFDRIHRIIDLTFKAADSLRAALEGF